MVDDRYEMYEVGISQVNELLLIPCADMGLLYTKRVANFIATSSGGVVTLHFHVLKTEEGHTGRDRCLMIDPRSARLLTGICRNNEGGFIRVTSLRLACFDCVHVNGAHVPSPRMASRSPDSSRLEVAKASLANL